MEHQTTLKKGLVVLCTILLAVSCTKERPITPVSKTEVQDYVKFIELMVNKSTLQMKPLPDSVYAKQALAVFKNYMTVNKLTVEQANAQWKIAFSSAERASNECENAAWDAFWDKQPACIAMTVIPFVGEVMSITCLVAAGLKLTHAIDKCRADAVKTTTPVITPK